MSLPSSPLVSQNFFKKFSIFNTTKKEHVSYEEQNENTTKKIQATTLFIFGLVCLSSAAGVSIVGAGLTGFAIYGIASEMALASGSFALPVVGLTLTLMKTASIAFTTLILQGFFLAISMLNFTVSRNLEIYETY